MKDGGEGASATVNTRTMGAHREGVWTGHDPLPCRAGPDWRRVAFEGGGLTVGAAILAALVAPFGLALPVAVIVLGGGAFGLMGRHADDRRRQAKEPVQELREEFGVGPAWKVELMVRQGEAPTGLDEGLIWIEEGRVVYSGLRTSFALVPAQASGTLRHEPGLPGQRLRLNLTLARTSLAGPLSLSFWPIAEGFRRAESDAAELRFAVNRTLNGGVLPETTGQWPPVALGPHAPTPRTLLLRALRPHLLGTGVAAGFGLIGAAFAPWIGVLVFAVGAGVANLMIRLETAPRWRAWRDARIVWRVA